MPGRTTQPQAPRTPSDPELHATTVLSIPIDEFSVKRRTGGPLDEHHDLDLPVWAGVIPMTLTPGAPITHVHQLADPPPVPDYTTNYQRP